MGGTRVVSIIGGTGDLGKGLALRLAVTGKYEIVIGSRSIEKARRAVESYRKLCDKCSGRIKAATNIDAAKEGDYVILAIPDFSVDEIVAQIKERIRSDSIVISPIVPMKKIGGVFYYSPPSNGEEPFISMAEYVSGILKPFGNVAAALQTLPAPKLADLSERLDYDVIIVCDDRLVYDRVARLVGDIDGLRPLYGGPLVMARYLEPLVPLLLNLGLHNGIRSPSIKIV